MKAYLQLILIAFLLLSFNSYGQATLGLQGIIEVDDDDLNVGGDIFGDFNEDLESSKVVEDERFYKYGRFFAINFALGTTTFSGNRGSAYEDQLPSYGFGVHYFMDFQNSMGLGVEFSKHNMFLSNCTYGTGNLSKCSEGAGFVDVKMLRVFLDYKYYIDTANLGTAITYSNPYFITRFEYWYLSNKFVDQPSLPADKGGGLGVGIGGGLEFPIRLKEAYIGLEALYHRVNFHDKYTQKYAPRPPSTYGYYDLTGDAYSLMLSYIITW